MRFQRKSSMWRNWFAWYPVWNKENREYVWLEWTHRYPVYIDQYFMGWEYRVGKKEVTR